MLPSFSRMQLASLVNTFVSISASPVILAYSEASELARVAVAVSLVGFGLFTTGALHWFTSPYVHELRYTPGTGMLWMQTINLFGRERYESVRR